MALQQRKVQVNRKQMHRGGAFLPTSHGLQRQGVRAAVSLPGNRNRNVRGMLKQVFNRCVHGMACIRRCGAES